MKMNLLILLSLVIFCFFASSCGKADAVSSRQLNESTPSRVMLEIEHSSFGSMDGVIGRNLEIRLYENGKFEYEEFSPEKVRESGKAFVSEVYSKKEGSLTEAQLTKFKEIFANKDFNSVNNYFKNAEPFCTCGESRTEIRFRNSSIRNINIDGSNCADLTNPDKTMFPDFPKILSQLLKQVQEIKNPNLKNS